MTKELDTQDLAFRGLDDDVTGDTEDEAVEDETEEDKEEDDSEDEGLE